MHRTGTRSLALYLQKLGLKDLHWPWWCEKQVAPHLDDPERVMDVLEPLFYRYDFLTDVPFPGLYRIIDRRFPNSRFILVRRKPASWWSSVCRHWELDKGPHRLDPFEEFVYRQYQPSGIGVASKDDASKFVSAFDRHIEQVESYFHGRTGKLLVVDLEDESINEKVSGFMGAPVHPYPRERPEEWTV